ncbi:beta-N-acetylglucosaminidase domain-containing protein [Streptomyces phytohabitans]|uniref:beta-N-acetylglucosaminidase domain-containing protein n=1 Tax=Streptomyces phytohabitans TaxID=1150371 RepID=UPI00387E4349
MPPPRRGPKHARVRRSARRAGAGALVAAFVGGLLSGAPAAQGAPSADGVADAPDDEAARESRQGGPPQVWPRPQAMRAGGTSVPLGAEVTLVSDADADPYALAAVRDLLRDAGVRTVHEARPGGPAPRGGAVVRLGGAAADGALRELRAPAVGDLPSGGYRLAVGRAGGRPTVALSGRGGDGLFHGVQTLRQLLDGTGGTVPGVVVRDWPTAAVRGVTEGFYGQPWTHEERLAQLDFLGRTKQNRYLYAPGGDQYREATRWRDPYPAERRAEFRELAQRAAHRHVTLGWAVSPGQGLCFSSAGDRKALLRKLDGMYALGVRAFQLQFDDVSYDEWHCGADADRYGRGPEAAAKAQAELANAVAEHLAKREGAESLSVLPTEFYQEGSSAYRAALSRELADGVELAWTGVGVVPRTITGGELADVRDAFPGHPVVTMDNYPVNDYAPDRLFLGPYQGRAPAVAAGSAAVLANAMEQPTVSRIPLFTAADYAWNPRGYRPDASWRAAVDDLAGPDPRTRAAVRALAGNDASSMLDGEESAYLRPAMKEFWAAYGSGGSGAAAAREPGAELRAAFRTMRGARDRVPAGIGREAGPWLRQLALWGEAGERAVDMLAAQAGGDGGAAWAAQLEVRRLRDEAAKKGSVTVGKGVLREFVDRALKEADGWTGVRKDAFGDEQAQGGPAARPGSPVENAVDGDPATAYRAGAAPLAKLPTGGRPRVPAPPDDLTVGLPATRELASVTVLTEPADEDGGTRADIEAHVPGQGWRRIGRLSGSGATEAAAHGLRADALRLRWSADSKAPVVHEITPWYADTPDASLALSRDDTYASIGGPPAEIGVKLKAHRPVEVRGRLAVDAPEGFTVRAPGRVTVPRGGTAEVPLTVTAGPEVRPGTYEVPVSFGDERRTLTVRAFPPVGGPDLARTAEASSSGDETADFPAGGVNDGRADTRWSSPAEDGAWVQLELARAARVGEVRLHWQDAYASRYRVQVSPDGRRWRTAATVRDGAGGRETVRMDAPPDTRFVRVQGDGRATRFGYSLWSVEVRAVRQQDDRERGRERKPERERERERGGEGDRGREPGRAEAPERPAREP